ncbi:hypothetical protein BJX63DRAFT_399348 [Aspergillus granulosus]|uniref:Uncharacterized protein n=1 Tax=Aspergillus granulosus TaxID=176169 RepID=A0ABR4H961_9EURO
MLEMWHRITSVAHTPLTISSFACGPHSAIRFLKTRPTLWKHNPARILSTATAKTSTIHWGRPPPFSALDLAHDTPYSRVASRMNRSGHLKWGFPIYRTTYEDDKLWDDFMASLYQHAEDTLEECGRRERLGPFFKCPVIQDKTTLDRASRATVRSHFQSWIRDVTDARDGPGAEAVAKMGAPQYAYCLIVDDASLARYKSVRSDVLKCGQVPVTLLPAHWNLEEYDGRWLPELDEDEDKGSYHFPEIEGTTNPFVDWMLLEQECITYIYDQLIAEDWYDVYVRPPRVYPDETDEAWKVF